MKIEDIHKLENEEDKISAKPEFLGASNHLLFVAEG